MQFNSVIFLIKKFHHFKTMTKEAGKMYIEKFKVHSKEMEGLLEKYQAALQQLPQVLKVCIYMYIIYMYLDVIIWLPNYLLKIDFKQTLYFRIFYIPAHEL